MDKFDTSKARLPKYSDSELAKILNRKDEVNKSAIKQKPTTLNVYDFNRAMEISDIDDYSKVPFSEYSDWITILKMNDSGGSYHNMLTFEKRRELINHINKWNDQNFC